MPTQDTSEIKEKILFILKNRGPSLPVHIAKETGLSMLFASAFLSELFSEKKIKISNMKIGSSPVYFLLGQEIMLENFSQYLKSKEKDAFILLKEKKFLKDKEQEPAIRVALRAIKDFAMPFKKNEEIFWRYFTISETEFQEKEKLPQKIELQKPQIKEKPRELNIFDKTLKKEIKKKQVKKKKTNKKQNEKFFNKVKEFLSKNSIEILDIENFSKNNLILRVKRNEKEQLVIAYNKKRINEADLIRAYKKASELNLLYIVLSLGEPPKKLKEFLIAIKNLLEINKLE